MFGHLGPLFQQTRTIVDIIQDIIKINVLTKFHEDWTINVIFRSLTRNNSPPSGCNVFQPTTNILTKSEINVASRVKNAPSPSGHVFQPTGTIRQNKYRTINVGSRMLTWKNSAFWPYMIGPKLSKFYEDQTSNVASRLLTRQMLTTHNAPQTKGDHKSSP
ncbi:hypothetical protein DPMN_070516 [Dreissena polymorpha]|uniref:Uncharacterized protein n=1 Tax=Dreissena polymorpha TaxID=45954 RepID=A0A9D4BVQ2_DREPO|nr:hypothetical protein DPMN_070516 [Dreissena polymorpha]